MAHLQNKLVMIYKVLPHALPGLPSTFLQFSDSFKGYPGEPSLILLMFPGSRKPSHALTSSLAR